MTYKNDILISISPIYFYRISWRCSLELFRRNQKCSRRLENEPSNSQNESTNTFIRRYIGHYCRSFNLNHFIALLFKRRTATSSECIIKYDRKHCTLFLSILNRNQHTYAVEFHPKKILWLSTAFISLLTKWPWKQCEMFYFYSSYGIYFLILILQGVLQCGVHYFLFVTARLRI